MTKRWLSEEDLNRLPADMTRRALEGAGARKKAGAQPEHLRSMPVVAEKKPAATGGLQAMQALGRLEKGELNKTEEAYKLHLDMLCLAGEVLWYRFEPFRLVLAEKTTYTPDFLVQLANGYLEVHEVKGRWMDDARVKIKVAAAMFPVFKFVAIQKGPDGSSGMPTWKVEDF